MAIAKFAVLTAVAIVGPQTRLLTFAMQDIPLGFRGGQYVIIDSAITMPNGKVCKRAYSLISCDTAQQTFTLAALRLGEGLGSNYMHSLRVGDTLKFSGPWGKLLAPEIRPQPSLVMATDTGITAALGLLQSAVFAPWLSACTFLWLRTSAEFFLPESTVQQHLPSPLHRVHMEALPPVDHVERAPHAVQVVRRVSPTGLGQAFLAGDGAVNAAVSEMLLQQGMPAERCAQESFFNAIKK